MIPQRIKSITQYHKILGCSKPEHPLISLINLNEFKPALENAGISVVFDFYIISLKRTDKGNVSYFYGQDDYDIEEGVMFFISPGQVFSFKPDENFCHFRLDAAYPPGFLMEHKFSKAD